MMPYNPSPEYCSDGTPCKLNSDPSIFRDHFLTLETNIVLRINFRQMCVNLQQGYCHHAQMIFIHFTTVLTKIISQLINMGVKYQLAYNCILNNNLNNIYARVNELFVHLPTINKQVKRLCS